MGDKAKSGRGGTTGADLFFSKHSSILGGIYLSSKANQ